MHFAVNNHSIRGYHIYQDIWNSRETNNVHDPFAAALKNTNVVVHQPG